MKGRYIHEMLVRQRDNACVVYREVVRNGRRVRCIVMRKCAGDWWRQVHDGSC